MDFRTFLRSSYSRGCLREQFPIHSLREARQMERSLQRGIVGSSIDLCLQQRPKTQTCHLRNVFCTLCSVVCRKAVSRVVCGVHLRLA